MAWLEIDWPSRGVTYKRLSSRESTTEDTSDSTSNISCNLKPKESTVSKLKFLILEAFKVGRKVSIDISLIWKLNVERKQVY